MFRMRTASTRGEAALDRVIADGGSGPELRGCAADPVPRIGRALSSRDRSVVTVLLVGCQRTQQNSAPRVRVVLCQRTSGVRV